MASLVDLNNEEIDPNNEERCPICFDDLKEIPDSKKHKLKKCGHTFHKECIKEWINKVNNYGRTTVNGCPLCRRVINNNNRNIINPNNNGNNNNIIILGIYVSLEQTELRINYSSDQFNTLEPEIGQLTNLESLDLANNELTEIPESIGNLTNLEWLNIEYNELESIQ